MMKLIPPSVPRFQVALTPPHGPKQANSSLVDNYVPYVSSLVGSLACAEGTTDACQLLPSFQSFARTSTYTAILNRDVASMASGSRSSHGVIV